MNLGNIPGFYFDEEKRKYMKIQPDHNAPSDAKYSASNVNRELRESKRVKLEHDFQRERKTQTLHRPWSSSNPLLVATGLEREQGQHQRLTYSVPREKAFAEGLQSNSSVFSFEGFPDDLDFRITDSIQLPGTDTELLSVTQGPQSHVLYCYPTGGGAARTIKPDRHAVWAFHSQINNIVAASDCDTIWLVACVPPSDRSAGGIHALQTTVRPTDPLDPRTMDVEVARRAVVSHCQTVHARKLHPLTYKLAFATNEAVTVVDIRDGSDLAASELHRQGECFAVDWLSTHTVAYSVRNPDHHPVRYWRSEQEPRVRNRPVPNEVRLWDVRVDGVVSRLHPTSHISGLEVVDHAPHASVPSPLAVSASPYYGAVSPAAGTQLLVTGVRGLDLYDLRFAKPHSSTPLLHIPHQSQTPQLAFATHRALGLVAAVENDGSGAGLAHEPLHVYSLRGAGRKLATLRLPPTDATRATSMRGGLRWGEDTSGVPYVQVCEGKKIHKWSWQGNDGDSAD